MGCTEGLEEASRTNPAPTGSSITHEIRPIRSGSISPVKGLNKELVVIIMSLDSFDPLAV